MTGKNGSSGFKRRALAFVVAVSMAAPSVTWAVMPVSDPMAYTYFVEQLKKAQEQINKMTEQIDTLGGIKDEAKKAYKAMSGTFGAAVSMKESITDFETAIENTPANLKKFGKQMAQRTTSAVLQDSRNKTPGGGASGASGGERKQFVSAAEVLDEVYMDLRDTDGRGRDPHRRTRYEMQQAAYRAMIINADGVLEGAKKRVKNIEKLMIDIDMTTELKEAMDLNNRIALEILKVNSELLIAVAQMAEAEGLARYTGLDAKVSKQLAKYEENAESGERGDSAHDRKMREARGGRSYGSLEEMGEETMKMWK